jgi:hypothetical protein
MAHVNTLVLSVAAPPSLAYFVMFRLLVLHQRALVVERAIAVEAEYHFLILLLLRIEMGPA